MKQTIIDIVKIMAAAFVAAIMAGVLVMHDASDGAVICTFFCTAIAMVALMGAFDERESAKHKSIKHYDGRRHYGQAAVFIGTACLFMGTPQQCEDVCDDMLHHGQQAHMEMLSGEETEFNIL